MIQKSKGVICIRILLILLSVFFLSSCSEHIPTPIKDSVSGEYKIYDKSYMVTIVSKNDVVEIACQDNPDYLHIFSEKENIVSYKGIEMPNNALSVFEPLYSMYKDARSVSELQKKNYSVSNKTEIYYSEKALTPIRLVRKGEGEFIIK